MVGRKQILVVDDSLIYRSQIKSIIETLDDVSVTGVVRNGQEALDFLTSNQVDLMVLDLEMPVMDGQQTLQAMKEKNINTPTIIFSAASPVSIRKTLDSLKNGVVDFIAKPSGHTNQVGSASDYVKEQLLPKIKNLLRFPTSSSKSHPPSTTAPTATAPPSPQARAKPTLSTQILLETFRPQAIVIATSTGGPPALEALFKDVTPGLSVPIFIVQHMPAGFTAALAERLKRMQGLNFKEATDGEKAEPGTIYIAPGGLHMDIKKVFTDIVIRVFNGPLRNEVRPCADILFESAADIFGKKLMGFVLTGMGADGRDGCLRIKEKGGAVMIQDQNSSVVWGMPGSVYEAGAYDRVGDLRQSYKILNTMARAK